MWLFDKERVPSLRTEVPGPNARQLLKRDTAFVSPSYTRFYPLAVKSAHGLVLEDMDGNQFLDFFYRRPYIRFYTTLLAELAPGGHWDQYISNYRLIHEMVLSGDAHSAVVTFTSHIRWVLRNMRAAGMGS